MSCEPVPDKYISIAQAAVALSDSQDRIGAAIADLDRFNKILLESPIGDDTSTQLMVTITGHVANNLRKALL